MVHFLSIFGASALPLECVCGCRYCDCFAVGRYCVGCNCKDCYNTVTHEAERASAIKSTLEKNPNAFQAKIKSVRNLL